MRVDLLTPIMLKTDSPKEQGKVLPFDLGLRENAPISTQKTNVELDLERESNTAHLIEFLEKRKKMRHQKNHQEKFNKYQKWIGVFKRPPLDPGTGVVLDKKI